QNIATSGTSLRDQIQAATQRRTARKREEAMATPVKYNETLSHNGDTCEVQ
ncbi:hypothetical protein BgiMline_010382, partial [Biomphalaria glabrata]